jgi:hypothetical protein
MDDDSIEVLAAILAQRIIERIYDKSQQCDCERCCPKSPSPPIVPDCKDLVNEVLREAGVKRPVPMRIKVCCTTVTIFAGSYAGLFGIIYQGLFSPCSCCVLVQTIAGVVKVSKKHCNIHLYP